jgi:acyl-CoA thioester hydrolase
MSVAGVPIYRTEIAPDWIDYNGHLRDAYYGLIVSYATDALMDRVGLDAPYRERTGCSLYTVEMHIHYLREVKKTDIAVVTVRIIAADHKRIHAALELVCEGHSEVAATAEIMLLHVHQGETVSTQPFPPEISTAIGELQQAAAGMPAAGPGSRRMELRARTG